MHLKIPRNSASPGSKRSKNKGSSAYTPRRCKTPKKKAGGTQTPAHHQPSPVDSSPEEASPSLGRNRQIAKPRGIHTPGERKALSYKVTGKERYRTPTQHASQKGKRSDQHRSPRPPGVVQSSVARHAASYIAGYESTFSVTGVSDLTASLAAAVLTSSASASEYVSVTLCRTPIHLLKPCRSLSPESSDGSDDEFDAASIDNTRSRRESISLSTPSFYASADLGPGPTFMNTARMVRGRYAQGAEVPGAQTQAATARCVSPSKSWPATAKCIAYRTGYDSDGSTSSGHTVVASRPSERTPVFASTPIADRESHTDSTETITGSLDHLHLGSTSRKGAR